MSAHAARKATTVPTRALRDELVAAARVIEIQTGGFLPLAGYVDPIDRALVPIASPMALLGFYPVVLKPDAARKPSRTRNRRGMQVGGVAVYEDRLTGFWMRGTLRLSLFGFFIELAEITRAELVAFDGMVGIDVDCRDGATATLAFPPRVGPQLADDWCDELRQLLDPGDASAREHRGSAS